MNTTSTIFSAKHISVYLLPDSIHFNIPANAVEKYWNSDPLVKHGSVFNAKILNLQDFQHHKDSLDIQCSYIDFKDFYISRKDPSLNLAIQPIGISGIIIGYDDNTEPYTYIAKRSMHVAHYAGFYELVPSGHLDNQNTLPDNTIDYKKKLLEEFKEETGLSPSLVTQIEECGFIYDKNLDVYDITCTMTLALTKDQLAQVNIPHDEYSSSLIITEQDLPAFLATHNNTIIPTSKKLLKLGFPYSR